jgi:NAD(P)-dependent dehydrogenase (short-subunit alcohol dehydrogenase family)
MQNESYSEMLLFIVFQELSKSLKSAKGKLYALKCDIAKESDVQAAFKWVKDNLGGVDILVNNAAVAYNNSIIGKSL